MIPRVLADLSHLATPKRERAVTTLAVPSVTATRKGIGGMIKARESGSNAA